MAQHFLTKTQVELGQCLDFAGGLALEAYPTLHQSLLARAGAEAARLFAEPLISRGNDVAPPSVSWYTDIEGEGTPFSSLDDSAQAELGAELSRQMRAIRELLDDPDDGPLVAAALHLRDASDVWSVSGRPVIINWGMLPKDVGRDAASRSAHYQRTLGRYLPLDAAPPLTAAERQQRRDRQPQAAPAAPAAAAGAAAGAAGAGLAAAATTAEAGTPPPPPPVRDDRPRRVPLGAWLPLVLLLLLAGGTLAWLLIPGNRIFPDRTEAAITNEAALAAAEGVNRALEERLASLEGALEGAVCQGDGTLLMPDGFTIEGLLPPNPNDPRDVPGAIRQASPQPVLPPDPERVQVPGGVAGRQDTATLLTHVEDRTAIVLAQGQGFSTGTGFFVGPDLLVTNFHVIADADPQGIWVTNKALGTVHQASILKTFGPMEQTGGDFALLRVPGVNQPAFTVLQGTDSLRLQPVIAAGYPGDLLRTDAAFQELRQGNAQAVPELAVTDGTISTEQRMSPQTSVVVHSAPISTGNSGGPLIDMCGRLIGVNTFVVQGPLRNLNFALSSADLMRFLQGTDALPTVVSQQCQPLLARPEAPTASASLGQEGGAPTLPPLAIGDQ